jgi:hypothetical protein
MQKRTASRSDAQQQAEHIALQKFGEELGIALTAKRYTIDGCRFDIDGYAETETTITLVECSSHIGTAKPAQRNKVLADVLKLALLQRLLKRENPDCTVRSVLLFIDDEAARTLRNASWGARAAQEFDVSVNVVTLDQTTLDTVRAAQGQQDLRHKE